MNEVVEEALLNVGKFLDHAVPWWVLMTVTWELHHLLLCFTFSTLCYRTKGASTKCFRAYQISLWESCTCWSSHGWAYGLRVLLPPGVTFRPRLLGRNWSGRMHWRDRFCLATLGWVHLHLLMFVGRLYWKRDVQVQRRSQRSSQEVQGHWRWLWTKSTAVGW